MDILFIHWFLVGRLILNSISVNYYKKIVRENRNSYISVETFENIKQWNLEVANSKDVSTELIIVLGKLHEENSNEKNTLSVISPFLLYKLPISSVGDEWPVVFREEQGYFPNYLVVEILEQSALGDLIERGSNLSKHSTKLITFKSLENSLIKVFGTYQPSEKWDMFSQLLINFINKLIEIHPYLGYLPIQERLVHRENYVSDLSFAWELYFQYFLEKWDQNKESIVIPDLNKNLEIDGWRGNFFNRNNPFWKDLLGERLRFKLNTQQKEITFKYWIKLLEEPN